MAETAPLMLLEATLVHVRMELEGKTAQKVSLEKPSLRTFPGCKWPFCRRRRWILGRTVSDKTSAGVIVSLLLSSCLFRLRIMNCRETWLNFFPSFQSIVSWRLPTIWLSIGLSSYLLPGSVSFARFVVHAPSPPVQGMTLTHLISWVQSQSTLGSSYVLFSKHVCPIELYQRLKNRRALRNIRRQHARATLISCPDGVMISLFASCQTISPRCYSSRSHLCNLRFMSYLLLLLLLLLLRCLLKFAFLSYIDIINECDSAPCIHGGTCINHLGHFECECGKDYAGPQCELGKLQL